MSPQRPELRDAAIVRGTLSRTKLAKVFVKSAPRLVEHFFRHEYGRLVASLSRRVGVQHLAAIEDAVQSALLAALATWPRTGQPDNPSAWLFRTARNALVGELRGETGRRGLLDRHRGEALEPHGETVDEPLPGEMRDDLLRMLFICCDSSVPLDSQLVLALKSLCGFSIAEIAQRLFTSEGNVYKRLGRARQRLRESGAALRDLDVGEYASRVPAVNRILYVLFTEGYLSYRADAGIRHELCAEAIRLAQLLAGHPQGDVPETRALLALMHLHSARLGSRVDASGGLLLLEEQDRTRWDQQRIRVGLAWLEKSATGECFSRYHAEAGIAAEHCLAESFAATRWDRVAASYELLERLAPSPVHRMNRAVAVAEWRGPSAGLAVLDEFEAPEWLARSYLWAAVRADLAGRAGKPGDAALHREAALRLAPSVQVEALLKRRLSPPKTAE